MCLSETSQTTKERGSEGESKPGGTKHPSTKSRPSRPNSVVPLRDHRSPPTPDTRPPRGVQCPDRKERLIGPIFSVTHPTGGRKTLPWSLTEWTSEGSGITHLGPPSGDFTGRPQKKPFGVFYATGTHWSLSSSVPSDGLPILSSR